MKKLFTILFSLTAAFIIGIPVIMFAQDSTSAIAASGTSDLLSNVFALVGKYIPTWVSTIIECLVVILPAIQFTLKKVPTTESVKIGGVLGWITDILTFFQKDIKTGGGTH